MKRLTFLPADRSVARLTLGDSVGALEDANEALKIEPKFHLVRHFSSKFLYFGLSKYSLSLSLSNCLKIGVGLHLPRRCFYGNGRVDKG